MAIKVSSYSVEVSNLLVKLGGILSMQSWKCCGSDAYSLLAEEASSPVQKYIWFSVVLQLSFFSLLIT